MRYLVTGGAGFLGSEAVRQLVAQGHEICVIDNLTYAGNKLNLQSVINQISFLKIDICNKRKLFNKTSNLNFDCVLNFAAETHVDNSILSPNKFIETNILGSQNIFDLALDRNIKLVHVSTDEVYGSINDGYSNEIDQLLPSSPYSASKASAEMILGSYIKTYGIDAITIRCSNNFGPYQHVEKFIPTVIRNAINNSQIPIYGTGENIREWIYVSDCISAIILASQSNISNEIFNVSSGIFASNLEIAKTILSILGRDSILISHVKDRLGHDFRYAMNRSKFIETFDWKPKVDLLNGLKRTVDWYIKNDQYLNQRKNFQTK